MQNGRGRKRGGLTRASLFVLGVGVCVVVYLFLTNVLPPGSRGTVVGVIPATVLAAGVLLLNVCFLRWEDSSVRALGLYAPRRACLQFGIGFVGGSALVLAWLLIIAAVTKTHWRSNSEFHLYSVIPIVAFLFFNNAAEELAYRGYLLLQLQKLFGSAPAVIGVSALFAWSHVQAGVPWSSAIAGVFTSGIVFAVIFLRWRSVPLALGCHLATNVVQELTGLRTSALSLVTPNITEQMWAKNGSTVLSLLAILNVAVAIIISRKMMRCSDDSNGIAVE